ncbi:MAG: hypothetical protein ABJ239_03410 [Erythrobacter sp.]
MRACHMPRDLTQRAELPIFKAITVFKDNHFDPVSIPFSNQSRPNR